MTARGGGGFLRALLWVRIGVASSGFMALALADELGMVAAVVASCTTLASGWEGRYRGSQALWLRIQVTFIAWLCFASVVQGVHSLSLLAQLLVFVQAHRLWIRRTSRDDLFICFIAFGQVLLASVLTIAVGFLFVFLAFALTSTWCLMLNQLVVAVEEDWRRQHGTTAFPVGRYRLLDPLARWPLFVSVGALGLALLVGTIALFFTLPRMQASMFSGGLLPIVHVSGFAERVRLGEVGAIKLSDEPVFRARVEDRSGRPLDASRVYWHGLALDRFDGRAWELSQAERTILNSRSAVGFRGPPPGRDWQIRQEIGLEPLDSRILFHLTDPDAIYGSFRTLDSVAGDGYYVPAQWSDQRHDYTVYSTPRRVEPELLRAQDPRQGPAALIARQTQLPEGTSPRIAEIAEAWTQGAASPADAILMIQRHLRQDYVYSLDQLASFSSDPLLAFLDDVKEGHCEYYASSMAVLLRTLGIPARIVNGFYGGLWNPVGRYWLVRQRDAHSWVEVHFPETGWAVYDPTPQSGLAPQDRIGLRLLARTRAWADYATVQWRSVLLDYGLGSQVDLLRRMVSRFNGQREFAWSRYLPSRRGTRPEPSHQDGQKPARGWVWALAVLMVCAGAFLVVMRSRRVGAALPPDIRKARRLLLSLQKCWEREAGGEDVASCASVAPNSGASFLAWATWAEQGDPDRFGDARTLVDAYYAARFGSEPLAPAVLVGLRSMRRASGRGPLTRW